MDKLSVKKFFFALVLLPCLSHAAMEFHPAITDYASVNISPTDKLNVTSGDFTLSCWAMLYPSAGINNNPTMGFYSRESNVPIALISLNPEPGRTHFSIRSDNGSTISPGGITNPTDGLWHHYCGIRQGNNARFYVDGVLIESLSLDVPFDSFSVDNFSLGALVRPVINFSLMGQMDDPAVYGRALSDQEIAGIASPAQRNNLADGRVGYWPLNGGNLETQCLGCTIFDRSGNGFDLTTSKVSSAPGGPTWKASNWLSCP